MLLLSPPSKLLFQRPLRKHHLPGANSRCAKRTTRYSLHAAGLTCKRPSSVFHFEAHKYQKLRVAISEVSQNTLVSEDYSGKHKAARSACFQRKEKCQALWRPTALPREHHNPSPTDYLLENITKCHARPQKGQCLSKHY